MSPKKSSLVLRPPYVGVGELFCLDKKDRAIFGRGGYIGEGGGEGINIKP